MSLLLFLILIGPILYILGFLILSFIGSIIWYSDRNLSYKEKNDFNLFFEKMVKEKILKSYTGTFIYKKEFEVSTDILFLLFLPLINIGTVISLFILTFISLFSEKINYLNKFSFNKLFIKISKLFFYLFVKSYNELEEEKLKKEKK